MPSIAAILPFFTQPIQHNDRNESLQKSVHLLDPLRPVFHTQFEPARNCKATLGMPAIGIARTAQCGIGHCDVAGRPISDKEEGREERSMRMKVLAAVAMSLAGLGALSVASAQPPAPPPQPDYHPSLADLMTMAVQPRHIKLGVAGKARNWDYVAYEARELRSAFNRVGRTVPLFNKQSMPDMLSADIVPAIDKLDAAIKAKDGAAFDAAYRDVTASCNNCHAGLDHAYVVIHEPSGSPYADQNLTGTLPRRGGRRRH
jgi:hypothetical protein